MFNRRLFVALVAFTGLSLFLSSQLFAKEAEYAANRVIIKYKNSNTASSKILKQRMRTSLRAKTIRNLNLIGAEVLEISGSTTVEAVIKQYKNDRSYK